MSRIYTDNVAAVHRLVLSHNAALRLTMRFYQSHDYRSILFQEHCELVEHNAGAASGVSFEGLGLVDGS